MADTLMAKLQKAMKKEGVGVLARRLDLSRQALYGLARGAWPRRETRAKLEKAGIVKKEAV